MDDFEERYFSINRKMMLLAAFWYTQACEQHKFRHSIIGFMLLIRLFTQVCQLFTLNFDLPVIVPILQSFITGVCFESLYYTSITNYSKVQKILTYIRQDWKQLKGDSAVKIMKKHAYQTKLFTIICGFMFYSYISFFILPLLLRKFLSSNEVMRSTDRFPTFSCYNYLSNRETYYYPIVICQAIILIVSTSVGLACYSSYFWFLQHICARLSIVKNEIHRQFRNCESKNTVPVIQADFSRWMIGVIQHQARTSELMNLVNTIAEKCYLFQMLLAFSLIVIDFLCIPVLLVQHEDKKDILALVGFIFTSVFPIYVNCHIGQQLIDYSVDVYKEACTVPIHEISLKTQKLLLTMLMLTSKPCTLSIGKFFVSSHEFFSDLVRTSLSFSMVLHSTQER